MTANLFTLLQNIEIASFASYWCGMQNLSGANEVQN